MLVLLNTANWQLNDSDLTFPCYPMSDHIQGVPKKTIPKRYKNKSRKSLLVLHVYARYKDYYIIILGAIII